MKNTAMLSDLLLDWYDDTARLLPWRVSPEEKRSGVAPDPYLVWLSEVMLQQTTVATVTPYFEKFRTAWPTIDALAAAPIDDVLAAWAGLGYYARARNLHKCAQTVANDYGGAFPNESTALRRLPGVGEYTAAAIAAIAFDEPAVVVDGNVERVVARLRRIETPLPDAKPEIKSAAAELTPPRRPGDYAQAVMDLGATVCLPRAPRCADCPWRAACRARRDGVAETLPRKRPKPEKPVRVGVAYLALDDESRVLLRRRAETGLLGGMLELPGGPWRSIGDSGADAPAPPPFDADWRDLGVEVRHTFTHFHLKLRLRGARTAIPNDLGADVVIARRADAFDLALPTLMKKALKAGLSAIDAPPTLALSEPKSARRRRRT